MPHQARAFGTLCIALLLMLPGITAAQDYPNRPVRLIVPFAPGGTTDSVGRLVAASLSTRLGQQVVVENRPGAGSQIGLEYVARVPADGYTLILGASDGLVILPVMKKKAPYDALNDFTPVAIVGAAPLSYTVFAKFPANSLAELIAYAKAKPGGIRYGSAGVGTTLHLGIELLQALTGTEMVHVPYKGGAPMMADIVAGQIELVLTSADFAKKFADSGHLRVLAQADTRRHALLPNAPTTTEVGQPELQAVSWFGVFGPAGLPKPIVDRVAKELSTVLQDPVLGERMTLVGANVRYVPPEGIAKLITDDTAKWGRVVRDAKIPLQD
ncbi:MAG: Bug family tripartite tricarboxylate transporter substrate binding protein [Burkholderiales bacterium]